MNLKKDKKFKTLLLRIRNCVVQLSNSERSEKYDWHKKSDLKCACAITSIFVAEVLNRLGYDCKIIQGVYIYHPIVKFKAKYSIDDINHCWVEVGDIIVDLTASQFGESAILLMDKHWKFSPVRITQFKNFNCRHFNDWPKKQKPCKVVLKTLLKIFNENEVLS
jgi:hypothetical protein